MMKKTTQLSRMLCLLAMVMAGVITASAADFMVDSICYNVIGDNQVEVTKRDVNYSGEVFIPETVVNDGITYQVTRIGNYAFQNCTGLTLVGIPEGVTEIGNWAFSYCTRLENIDMPNSLVSLGEAAFMSCNSFTSIHIPRNLAQIGYNTFSFMKNVANYTCSSLNTHFKAVGGVLYSKDMTMLVVYPPAAPSTSFDIPGTVTSIHDYCFCNSTNLTAVNFPESVTYMGMNIFRNCSGLLEVDIPDAVTHMGMTVFGNCTSLTRVHLPASLDSLMSSTFSSCTQLTEVTIPRNVSFIDEQCFLGDSNLKNVIIEDGSRLTSLGTYAFRGCSSLESVNLPNTLTSVGMGCFSNCRALKKCHLGDNLTEIGSAVFWECNELTEGEVIGSVPNMKNIFVMCPKLKRVVLGDKNGTPGITTIENCGISMCQNLEYLELGASIDTLETHALVELDSLKVLICWAAVPPRCNDQWHSFDPDPQYFKATVYVPKASLEAYRTAREWKDFPILAAIEDVGDINGDGSIDIADETALISMVLKGNYYRVPYADVNLDGQITIADVTALISRVLK